MNLLLDTHVALWAITDSPRLLAKARGLIEAPRNTVWVSAVSIWEITKTLLTACWWPKPCVSQCAC